MAGVTGKAQIDQAVKKFLVESRYTLQERPGVVKSSIRHERLPERQGPSVNIPKYGQVTTAALTEGVDMAQAQQITDTAMIITPAEFGAQVVLTDMMLMTVKDEFFRVAGRILGESFDRQQDQVLCDDFDGFTTNVMGGAATVMHQGHIMAAEARLKGDYPAAGTAGRGGEPAPGSITCIHTPAGFHAVRKAQSGNVQSVGAVLEPGDGSIKAFGVEFDVGSVRCKSDINLNKDTSNDVKGATLSEEAMILVTLGEEANEERERDASLRAWELNFVGRWARGEYDDSWAAEMYFASDLPTA